VFIYGLPDRPIRAYKDYSLYNKMPEDVKRIDFNRYAAPKEEPVSGGLISENMKEVMSENMQLKCVVKLIADDTTIFWVSNGDWSMHELLLEILNITGPAQVHISSYAMSETPARILAQLKNAGMITKLNCVLDNRIDVRTAGSFQLMKSISDRLVLVDTHAKVTVVENDAWHVAVVGSANYTENKRYEAGILTTCKPGVEMQLKWMEKALKDGIE
jgi:hypothetical protein